MIVYDVGTNTITVTGFTELVPCTFNDLYNEDIAQGWGVIYKQGVCQYKIDSNINIGTDLEDAYFKSINEQIFVNGFNIYSDGKIKIYRNSIVQFGDLIDNIPTNGSCVCSNITWFFSIELYNNSTLKLYATKITDTLKKYSMIRQGGSSTIIGKEVMLDGVQYGFYSTNVNPLGYNLDLENTIVQNCKYFMGCATDIASLSLNNIASHKTTLGMYVHSSVLNDVNIRNYIQTMGAYLFDARISVVDFYMINAITNTWQSRYQANSVSKTYRQYTVNVKTEPEATVKIWQRENDDNFEASDIVFNGQVDINGNLPEQILTYKKYAQSGETQYYHQIEISKINCATYKTKVIVDEEINCTHDLTKRYLNIDSKTWGNYQ